MINTAIAVGLPFGQLTPAQRATALLRLNAILTELGNELITESGDYITLE